MNGQMLEVFQHGVRRGRDEERAADLVEDIDLTPAEAERLARALTKAAAAARAKRSK